MTEPIPFRRWHDMQEMLERALAPARFIEQQQRLMDQVRDFLRPPLLQVAAQTDELLRRMALPEFRVPAWPKVADHFAVLQARWVESLPENWRSLSAQEMSDVATLMQRTGWGLAWVPRVDILRNLVGAADLEEAEQRLLAQQSPVLDDLMQCLREVTDGSLTDLVAALGQAIRAYQADCPYPAQAMVATILTTAIQQQLEEPNLSSIGELWRAIEPDESPLLAFRRQTILRAVGESLRSYWVSRGDPIPSRFNRHATAHHFDLTQFNQQNALAGLMLAVSLLREFQAAADEGDERAG